MSTPALDQVASFQKTMLETAGSWKEPSRDLMSFGYSFGCFQKSAIASNNDNMQKEVVDMVKSLCSLANSLGLSIKFQCLQYSYHCTRQSLGDFVLDAGAKDRSIYRISNTLSLMWSEHVSGHPVSLWKMLRDLNVLSLVFLSKSCVTVTAESFSIPSPSPPKKRSKKTV